MQPAKMFLSLIMWMKPSILTLVLQLIEEHLNFYSFFVKIIILIINNLSDIKKIKLNQLISSKLPRNNLDKC
jgi:hypothetical protein